MYLCKFIQFGSSSALLLSYRYFPITDIILSIHLSIHCIALFFKGVTECPADSYCLSTTNQCSDYTFCNNTDGTIINEGTVIASTNSSSGECASSDQCGTTGTVVNCCGGVCSTSWSSQCKTGSTPRKGCAANEIYIEDHSSQKKCRNDNKCQCGGAACSKSTGMFCDIAINKGGGQCSKSAETWFVKAALSQSDSSFQTCKQTNINFLELGNEASCETASDKVNFVVTSDMKLSTTATNTFPDSRCYIYKYKPDVFVDQSSTYCTDVAGGSIIQTMAECEAIAKELGWPDTTAIRQTSIYSPIGCFEYKYGTTTILYFNDYAGSYLHATMGKCSSQKTCKCKQTSEQGTEPTQAFCWDGPQCTVTDDSAENEKTCMCIPSVLPLKDSSDSSIGRIGSILVGRTRRRGGRRMIGRIRI